MNAKLSISSLIIISILPLLSTPALGRSIIKGQVVDAETGKPIEKAAVYIYWGKPGSGPPGLAASSVEVEVAEVLTDVEGVFRVPKYSTLFKHYRMALYKKGYVCWSSEKVFPTWEDRKDFKLKNGMVIKLEHFKDVYSREDHGRFTVFMSTSRNAPGLFDNAIKLERLLFRKMMRSK